MPLLENYYVCSEHFSAESIEVNLRAQITETKCKRRLKKDAIPSEFCFPPPAKRPRLSGENRLRSRSHEEVIVFCFCRSSPRRVISIILSIRMRVTDTKTPLCYPIKLIIMLL